MACRHAAPSHEPREELVPASSGFASPRRLSNFGWSPRPGRQAGSASGEDPNSEGSCQTRSGPGRTSDFSGARACTEVGTRATQAVGLCHPATRRTEEQRPSEAMRLAPALSGPSTFRSASRRRGRAGRPDHPWLVLAPTLFMLLRTGAVCNHRVPGPPLTVPVSPAAWPAWRSRFGRASASSNPPGWRPRRWQRRPRPRCR